LGKCGITALGLWSGADFETQNLNKMTKAELLEIIKDYPDDVDLVFTQETERQAGDVSDMYLDHLTECKAFNYINLYFKWTDVGE
jgi:hypothetical protein